MKKLIKYWKLWFVPTAILLFAIFDLAMTYFDMLYTPRYSAPYPYSQTRNLLNDPVNWFINVSGFVLIIWGILIGGEIDGENTSD